MRKKFIYKILGSFSVILASLVLINYLPKPKGQNNYLSKTGSFNQAFSPTISPIPTNHLPVGKNEMVLTLEKYPDIMTIYQYYLLLNKGQLLDAYNMHSVKTISKEQFILRYGKLTHIEADHFINVGPNTYTFSVDMTDLDNPMIQYYLVTIKVIGDKIQTISSEPIYHQVLKSDNSLFYSVARGNKDILVFNNGGKEKEISWAYNNQGPSVDFEPKYLSPKKTYLVYEEHYWEGLGLFLYRIDNGSILKIEQSFITHYQMTPDEQKMIVCSGRMDGSNYGSVYEVDTAFLEFRHKFDRSENFFSLDCQIERDTAVFEYKEEPGITKQVIKQPLN